MQTFSQYTTGIVLRSVAVWVSIYQDTYPFASHVSRYVLYRMTAVSSQPNNYMMTSSLNLMAIVCVIANLFFDLPKNDIVVHYNKFPDLGVYHASSE